MSKATVIYCPSRTDLAGKRVLFLAGPSRFAPLWRIEAITYLLRRLKEDVVIASPQRLDDMTSGPYLPQKKKEPSILLYRRLFLKSGG